ncbi:coronin-7-like [Lytechinus pictus]|uniref:coronin-7-like n=1 Tax=Lytechinus pictus TaxID=7653 RepID=UPI0030B9EDEA
MSRFKVSKFKNAFCVNPKRETWISDVRVGSPSSCGNHIKASGAYMAYNADSPSGGVLGLLDVNSVGRQSQNLYLHHAHSSLVTDLDFSPFNDYLLATCSQDKTIKIWDLPEGGFADGVSGPVCSFQGGERRVENVLFHPTASDLLTASVFTTVKIYDLTCEQEALAVEVSEDQLQGISWKLDGTLLATTSKDKKIRIVDPRTNSVSSETNGHDNIRDSRVCWLGDRDYILSTGFNDSRGREVKVYDTRNFGLSCASMDMGTATGILMPMYDPDTQLVFLAGKGDQRVGIFEYLEGQSRISECSVYSSDQQQKGICLVPKKVLDVMSCEVGRLLQLTKQGIIPIKVEVPRTSHRNFYPELFPETAGDEPALSSTQWLEGKNEQVAKICLDPAKRKDKKPNKPANQQSAVPPSSNQIQAGGDAPSTQKENAKASLSQSPATQPLQAFSSSPSRATTSSSGSAASSTANASSAPSDSTNNTSPKKKFTMAQTSKFRHLQGTLGQRSQHIYNIRNASINVFGECDGFHANKRWAALPLTGSGGLITIIDINKPGKLPETGVPTIQNSSTMTDFTWDPFNDCRLAVACDDAKIRLWSFPEEGFEGTLTEPDFYLRGHQERIYLIKFHPLASDVLLSASYDMLLKIWDLTTGEDVISLEGHTDQIFSAAWSPDGKRIATVCKDGFIRVYEPRSSKTPVAQGPGPEGSRGARIFWVHNGELLAVSGFEKTSERSLSVHDPKDLSKALETLTIDKSPATLIPYYDPDTHVVWMTAKGERLVSCVEILKEEPYFFTLSNYASPEGHQAFSFLPKMCCVVKDVEFMRALKLSKTTIEPVHFTLPRVKKEYFQDDVFPDTKVTWEPVLTGSDWFSGKDGQCRTISLCPEGMKYLSSIPKAGPAPKKYSSEKELTYKTDAQKREEIMAAMNDKLSLKSEPLPQDEFEGVDDDEWDD